VGLPLGQHAKSVSRTRSGAADGGKAARLRGQGRDGDTRGSVKLVSDQRSQNPFPSPHPDADRKRKRDPRSASHLDISGKKAQALETLRLQAFELSSVLRDSGPDWDSLQRIRKKRQHELGPGLLPEYCATQLAIWTDKEGHVHASPNQTCKETVCCPICAALRAGERKADLAYRVNRIQGRKGTRWLLVTLTGGRTVSAAELPKRMKRILQARKKLVKKLSKLDWWLGCAWGMEIAASKAETGEYHPHVHMLVAVDGPSYYRGSCPALTPDRLRDLWEPLMGWDQIAENGDRIWGTDIRSADRNAEGDLVPVRVHEVAKYLAKPCAGGDHPGEWWLGLKLGLEALKGSRQKDQKRAHGEDLRGMQGIFRTRSRLWKELPELARPVRSKPSKVLGFCHLRGDRYSLLPANVQPIGFEWLRDSVSQRDSGRASPAPT